MKEFKFIEDPFICICNF